MGDYWESVTWGGMMGGCRRWGGGRRWIWTPPWDKSKECVKTGEVHSVWNWLLFILLFNMLVSVCNRAAQQQRTSEKWGYFCLVDYKGMKAFPMEDTGNSVLMPVSLVQQGMSFSRWPPDVFRFELLDTFLRFSLGQESVLQLFIEASFLALLHFSPRPLTMFS